MPYINIKLSKVGGVGLSQEKKAEVIQKTTQVLVDVLGRDPKTIMVLLEEADTDNWGSGGITVTEIIKAGK